MHLFPLMLTKIQKKWGRILCSIWRKMGNLWKMIKDFQRGQINSCIRFFPVVLSLFQLFIPMFNIIVDLMIIDIAYACVEFMIHFNILLFGMLYYTMNLMLLIVLTPVMIIEGLSTSCIDFILFLYSSLPCPRRCMITKNYGNQYSDVHVKSCNIKISQVSPMYLVDYEVIARLSVG